MICPSIGSMTSTGDKGDGGAEVKGHQRKELVECGHAGQQRAEQHEAAHHTDAGRLAHPRAQHDQPGPDPGRALDRHQAGPQREGQRDRGAKPAGGHAGHADGQVAADGQQRHRGESADRGPDQPGRLGAGRQPLILPVRADGDQLVVHQRLHCARGQGTADAPEHEAGGKCRVARRERPQREAGAAHQGGHREKPAAGHHVGQCAGRHLQGDRGQ
jgi:hypothetical protein